MVNLPAVQGDVATGKGSVYARQIKQVKAPVEFVDKTPSGAVRYKLTKPEDDKRLHRPGYTNNVSVLIDLHGQEFQFKAPLPAQPDPVDLDIAHSVLDRMRDGARAGGQFEPERPEPDMVGFMIKQQAKERALQELEKKEYELLYKGYSPEQIAALSSEERERIERMAQLASPVANNLRRLLRGDDVDVAGPSTGVGVVPLTQGPQTVPALSVPNAGYRAGPGAGIADSMGRTRPTGAPSQGFVSNRAPATGSAMSAQYLQTGQTTPFGASLASTPYSQRYGSGAQTPATPASERSRIVRQHEADVGYARRLDPLQRQMYYGGVFGQFREVRGLPTRPTAGQVRALEQYVLARSA